MDKENSTSTRWGRVLPALAVVLFLVSGSGCAVGRYFENRALDFSDVVRFEFGFPAVGFHLEATTLFNTGLDYWAATPEYGATAGNYQSRVPDQAELTAYSVLFFHARNVDLNPLFRDASDDSQFPPSHAGTITHVHQLGYAFDEQPCPENLQPIHWFDVEADWACLLGMRLRVSPGQLVDFLLGWFGLDIGGDDVAGENAGQTDEELATNLYE